MSDQHAAMHDSAPFGCKCSDCTIDKEPCPACYAAWRGRRHPNTVFVSADDSEIERLQARINHNERVRKSLLEDLKVRQARVEELEKDEACSAATTVDVYEKRIAELEADLKDANLRCKFNEDQVEAKCQIIERLEAELEQAQKDCNANAKRNGELLDKNTQLREALRNKEVQLSHALSTLRSFDKDEANAIEALKGFESE